MQTGSLTNLLMSRSRQSNPEVGMGATEIMWTDRRAYTIVEVRNPKTIVVQEDNAKRTDNNGMSESQRYEFTPNLEGEKIVVTLRKNGKWIRRGESQNGRSFVVGYRTAYHDYSF